MSDNLYNSSGIMKTDHIRKALHNAKFEGKLHNVQSHKIDKFVDAFEQQMEEHRSKFGRQITSSEARGLMKEVARNHHDNISQSELDAIEDIVADRNNDTE